MSDIKIGWSKRQITPNENVYLNGYRPIRKSTGVHDDLYVKTFYFQSTASSILLVVFDLVAVDKNFTQLIKNEINQKLDTEIKIIVAATHTHSGVEGTLKTNEGVLKGLEDVFGERNSEYVDYLIRQTVVSALESCKNIQKCQLKKVETSVPEVTSNRNEKDGFTDDTLWAIEFQNRTGEKALIWHYSCHPTVLNKRNKLISKDFPYAVEEMMDHYTVCLYLNGSAGDLSTRFTRRESSFKQVDLFGKIIREKITKELQKTAYIPLEKIRLNNYTVSLKTKAKLKNKTIKSEDVSETSKKLQQSYIEGQQTSKQVISNVKDKEYLELPIQIFQLNHTVFVTFPGEIFSSLLQSKFHHKNIKILGYANGYYLYLPDKSAYSNNYYEALSSPFMKGEGEEFVKKVEKILKVV